MLFEYICVTWIIIPQHPFQITTLNLNQLFYLWIIEIINVVPFVTISQLWVVMLPLYTISYKAVAEILSFAMMMTDEQMDRNTDTS